MQTTESDFMSMITVLHWTNRSVGSLDKELAWFTPLESLLLNEDNVFGHFPGNDLCSMVSQGEIFSSTFRVAFCVQFQMYRVTELSSTLTHFSDGLFPTRRTPCVQGNGVFVTSLQRRNVNVEKNLNIISPRPPEKRIHRRKPLAEQCRRNALL